VDLATRERPIQLADIDRLLADSTGIESAGAASPIRAWRDELTLALESLAYAGTVLSADVAILRRCVAPGGSDGQAVVDDLPVVVSSLPSGDGWSGYDDPEDEAWTDHAVFARSESLLSAHGQMARLDLSSPNEVTRALRDVEEQLSGISERHGAVQLRLREIRAAIIRRYRDGGVTTREWLG